jgi:hypothetical protein
LTGSLNVAGTISVTGSIEVSGPLKQNGLEVARPYKVYTALLTQTGVSSLHNIGNYSTLVVGRTYIIGDYKSGDDFTNVGAPNNNIDTYFVATGATPNNFTNGSTLQYDSGAPEVTVLENTIGDIWWEYLTTNTYVAKSVSKFLEDKTLVFYTAYSGTNGDVSSTYTIFRQDDSTIGIGIVEPAFLNKTPIEIRVYN